MRFKSSHKVHNVLRILLPVLCRLKMKRKANNMGKILGKIIKRAVDYVKEIINEEAMMMDMFYKQSLKEI